MWPNQRVQTLAQAIRSERLRDVNVGAHGKRVDTGVGPPGSGEGHGFAGHPQKRLFERLLDRRTMVLPLPTHERATVIFDRQPPAGHWRIVPEGIGKPRSNSC